MAAKIIGICKKHPITKGVYANAIISNIIAVSAKKQPTIKYHLFAEVKV